MSLKRLIAIIILLTIAALWMLRNRQELASSNPAPTPAKSTSLVVDVAQATAEEATILLPIAEEAIRLHDPQSSALDDVQILTSLLQEHRRHLGGNPIGDNAEITAALAGANAKHFACLSADVLARVAPSGQMLDRWGHPYFFHAQSGTMMEIISAGPDGIIYNDDDVRGGDAE